MNNTNLNRTQLTLASEEVVRLYESCKLSLEAIVEETGYELTAIKAILVNHSQVYQETLRSKKTPGVISDEELDEFTNVIKDVARYSEIDPCRLRAAIYLRDDKLGRLDAIHEGGNLTLNVLTLNAGLKKLKQLKQSQKQIKNVETQDQLTQTPPSNYPESARDFNSSPIVELELAND